MNASPLSPVPTMPRGWTYNFQRDYFAPRGGPETPDLVVKVNSIAQGIDAVCHRFGVTIARATVYQRGEHISVYLDLAAGEWQSGWSARTVLLGHPCGRLCARLLRFLNSVHEELG